LAYFTFHTEKKDELLDLAEPLVSNRIEESHDRILRSSWDVDDRAFCRARCL